MDKERQRELRKLRKKAIKLQNQSSVRLSMAEALRRAANEGNENA